VRYRIFRPIRGANEHGKKGLLDVRTSAFSVTGQMSESSVTLSFKYLAIGGNNNHFYVFASGLSARHLGNKINTTVILLHT
jgi:hypothetical protein